MEVWGFESLLPGRFVYRCEGRSSRSVPASTGEICFQGTLGVIGLDPGGVAGNRHVTAPGEGDCKGGRVEGLGDGVFVLEQVDHQEAEQPPDLGRRLLRAT
jgi:hypothetical protein